MPKTILVTGAAGFVGHHCVDHIFKNTDWNIIVLDSLNYAGDMNRLVDSEVFDTKRVKLEYQRSRQKLKSKVEQLWKLIGNEQERLSKFKDRYKLNKFNEKFFHDKSGKIVQFKKKLAEIWAETLKEDD